MAKKWVISLNEDSTDPTWVVLNDNQILIEVEETDLDEYDWVPPNDCATMKEAHIHIKDLLENSHWADHSSTY